MELSHADRKHLRRARLSGNRVIRWTDEEILDAVRQAETEGISTSPEYQTWASGSDHPSFRTITARYGSWKNARQRAGFSSSRTENWTWRTTNEQHLDAVVRCARALQKLPTLTEYRAFRESLNGVAPEWPSDALIRTALGGWGKTLELVSEELERTW